VGRTAREPLRLVQSPPSNGRSAIEPYDELASVAAAAANGDAEATRTLVLTIGPHLLRVVRKVLGAQHPDIDDVVQDCAFGVIEALPKRRGESTVLHFACRVAALSALKVRRRDATQKRYSIRAEESSVELCPSSRPTPDEVLSARVSASLMRELLDSLPFEQAEVLMLHCVLGFTIQEMAVTSQVSVETLRSRMRLAKQALRLRVLADPRMGELIEEPS